MPRAFGSGIDPEMGLIGSMCDLVGSWWSQVLALRVVWSLGEALVCPNGLRVGMGGL